MKAGRRPTFNLSKATILAVDDNQQALDIQYRALNYEESPWGRVAGTALRELGLL